MADRYTVRDHADRFLNGPFREYELGMGMTAFWGALADRQVFLASGVGEGLCVGYRAGTAMMVEARSRHLHWVTHEWGTD